MCLEIRNNGSSVQSTHSSPSVNVLRELDLVKHVLHLKLCWVEA